MVSAFPQKVGSGALIEERRPHAITTRPIHLRIARWPPSGDNRVDNRVDNCVALGVSASGVRPGRPAWSLAFLPGSCKQFPPRLHCTPKMA